MDKQTGGPAFPSKKRIYRAGYVTNEFEPIEGMTLRDYFAAKAMQAILSNPNYELPDEKLAGSSYVIADVMLKAREA